MKAVLPSTMSLLLLLGPLWACDGGDPTEPQEVVRDADLVCDRWREVEQAAPQQPGAREVPQSCDAPATDGTEVAAALLRLNAARWLAGVAEVGTLAAHQRLAEQVALLMARNRTVAPVPDRGWACYDDEVGTAYRWTSHALGVSSVEEAVRLFVEASGDPSLANRCWMLDPLLDGVGLARVADAAAVYVRGYVPRPAPQFVAYPGPGAFPLSWMPEVWSFAANVSLDAAQLEVTDSAGRSVPFATYVAQTGGTGMLSTLAMVPGEAVFPGVYEVSLQTLGGRWGYRVEVTDCSARAR